jgi:membrane associated rhomboid family serine protease
VARLVDPGAFQRLVTAPDYGVSAICAAWLGAVAGTGWQKRGESIRRAAIVLGCVAAASLAWFVRGRGLDVLDSEHVFAFGIGVAAANAKPFPRKLRVPKFDNEWRWRAARVVALSARDSGRRSGDWTRATLHGPRRASQRAGDGFR